MLNAKEMYEEFFRGDETVTPFEALSSRTKDNWRRLASASQAPGPEWSSDLQGVRDALREAPDSEEGWDEVRSEVVAVVQRHASPHVQALIEILYLDKPTVSMVEEVLKRCG